MNMQQPDFPEATVVETLQRLEEAAARIFGALRDNARQQRAQQADDDQRRADAQQLRSRSPRNDAPSGPGEQAPD